LCVLSIRVVNRILRLSILSTHRWCYRYVVSTNSFFFLYRTKIIQPEHLPTINGIKNKSIVEQSSTVNLHNASRVSRTVIILCTPPRPATDAVNYILLRIALNLMSYWPNALYVSVHILRTINAAHHTAIV